VKTQKDISTTKKVKKAIPSTKDQREAQAKASVAKEDGPKSVIKTLQDDSGIRQYLCTVCNRVRGDKSNMIKHAVVHFEERTY
jgi:excinuclease UvrABC helicase subunit UvrB